MTSSHVKHPILRLQVIDRDGQERSEHRVFCRLQRRSIEVEECCSCIHCDEIEEGAAPTVNCTLPIAADDPASDPSGEQTEIGTLLRAGAVVVADDVDLRAAFARMRAEDRRSIAIVDDESALVGVLHEAGFVGRRAATKEVALAAAMSSAVALHERTSVRAALRYLAANHLREATVVSDDGIPIGTFRDIDGLHFISVARDSAPPKDP